MCLTLLFFPVVRKVNAKICYNITDGAGKSAAKWVLDLKKGSNPSLTKVTGAVKVDMTLTVKDDDMIALAQGQLNPQPVHAVVINA